jgi:hypothetical protein
MTITDMNMSLASIMLIVACEAVLLTFLYFISRFYEIKFGQKTFSVVFIVAAVLLVMLLCVAMLDVNNYDPMIIANFLTLGVLLVFGIYLFRTMTGVTK